MTSLISPVFPATAFVNNDEDAFTLFELNKRTPDSKGIHRYRYIHVVRDDTRCEYVEDLGNAKYYGNEFEIPGGVGDDRGRFEFLHTVGELIDMAQKLAILPTNTDRIMENATDLVAGYHDQLDKKANLGKRQFAITRGRR